MLIANCADLHLRGKDLSACANQLMAMADVCIERGVKLVCVAGDVFDRPNIGDNHETTGKIEEVALRWGRLLEFHNINILIIPGNHDYSGPSCADACHAFDSCHNVTIHRGEEHDAQNVCENCPLIVTVPWLYDGNAEEYIKKRMREFSESHFAFAEELRSGKGMLLGHLRVMGGKLNGGATCDTEHGWTVSREFLESLPVDHFALGDFHGRQELVAGKGGYIGALRQCNFGEEGNPAGFELWDSNTGETEWIELTAAPRHRTVILRPGETAPAAAEGEILRVRFQGMPDTAEAKKLEANGVVVEAIIEARERLDRPTVALEGSLADPRHLLNVYSTIQTPPLEAQELAAARVALERVISWKEISE